MAAKKVSAYNRHVGAEMKRGKTMKQAAASWKKKGKGGKKKKPAKKQRAKPRKKSGGRTVAKRRTKKARAAAARKAAKSWLPKTVPSILAVMTLANMLDRPSAPGVTRASQKLANGNYIGALQHVVIRASRPHVWTAAAPYAIAGHVGRKVLGPGPKLVGPVRWW